MAAVYKRFGSSVEHDMPVRFEITKGVLCMLMEIDEEEFVYILDSQGNTVCTMLTGSSTFSPPAPGTYTVKTNSDLNNAAGTNLNPLEFMWRGMRHLNRFPLNLATVNTYMLAQIMKKMDYKSFVKVSRTCKSLRDIPKEHPRQFCLSVPFTCHIGILNEGGGTSGFVSFHYEGFWDRPHPRAKWDKDYEVPLSELHFLQPFSLDGLRIDQPNRDNFNENHRMEELENISKAVVESKMQYRMLYVERCTMKEVLVLLGGIRPKRASIRMCSFDMLGTPTHFYDNAMNRFHTVMEDFGFPLPEELVIISQNFHYLSQFPEGRSMCDLVSQVKVFQAVTLTDAPDQHETAFNFIEEFGAGKDLCQNKVTMFVLRNRCDFLWHFMRRENLNELIVSQMSNPRTNVLPKTIRLIQCTFENRGKKVLFHQSRAYRHFVTYSFAEVVDGNVEKAKSLIEEAHENLDDVFLEVQEVYTVE